MATEIYLSCEFGAHKIGDITTCDLVIATQIHGYPHYTGSDVIIWISGTGETTSLLHPLILVSHISCSKTVLGRIQTHDHSHTIICDINC